MRIGRFWVHGSHHRGTAPAGSVPLQVDAATAFGTGEHATTDGCLLAMDDLAKRSSFKRLVRSHGPVSILDFGCGTGILAMVAGKSWSCAVLASDIDPEAVRVSRRVVRANGLHNIVRVIHADGVSHRSIRSQAPFVLITANILARPLRRLSADLTAVLAPGGCLVLSGLLQKQIPFVLNAYRTQGLRLERLYRLGEWATLVVRR